MIIRGCIGPSELRIQPITLVFEFKSGFIRTTQVLTFYKKLIDTYEFKHSLGSIKANVIPILIGARTLREDALTLAGQLGIKVIWETQLRELWQRLTGEELTFKKFLKRYREDKEKTIKSSLFF